MQKQISELVTDVKDWIESDPSSLVTVIGGAQPTDAEVCAEDAWRARGGPLADRMQELAADIGATQRKTAIKIMELAGLIRDGLTFDSRADHPCAAKVLRSLTPELTLIESAREQS